MQGVDAGGTASYNGLLLSVQRRAARGITVSGNYTWSHCISDPSAGDNLVSNGTEGYTDPNNRRFDRGNCNRGATDRRQVFNSSAVVHTPRFSNPGLRAVASGWSISPIFKIFSGSYLNVTSGQDRALNATSNNQRVNQILANPYGDKSVNNYLNLASFAQPALGTLGNSGAGSILGPGTWQFDAALSRTFRWRETQKMELRVEAFNVTNSFRMNDPNSSLNSALFGKVTSAKDPRILQFALKYVF